MKTRHLEGLWLMQSPPGYAELKSPLIFQSKCFWEVPLRPLLFGIQVSIVQTNLGTYFCFRNQANMYHLLRRHFVYTYKVNTLLWAFKLWFWLGSGINMLCGIYHFLLHTPKFVYIISTLWIHSFTLASEPVLFLQLLPVILPVMKLQSLSLASISF